MKRIALILGYTGKGEEYCEGVGRDISNYKNYLMSLHGGAWKEDEIQSCFNVTKKSLLDCIESAGSEYDYALIIFSGHGCYNLERNETVIWINDNEAVYESQLETSCLHQLTILDCCRKYPEVLNKSIIREQYFSAEDGSYGSNREIYRNKFDKLLSESVEEHITVYACSRNQYSNDDSEFGGDFTVSLLRNASGKNDLTIFGTYKKAKQEMESGGKKQVPQIKKTKKGNSVPFYIA